MVLSQLPKAMVKCPPCADNDAGLILNGILMREKPTQHFSLRTLPGAEACLKAAG